LDKKNKTSSHWFGRNLRNNFLSGFLIVIPLAVTIFILVWLFITLDDVLQPLITAIGTRIDPDFTEIRGLGVIAAIILLYLAGLITNNYLGKKLVKITENAIERIPVLKQLYSSIKQVIESVTGKGINKAAFREVVFVEFPRKGMTTPAFVTNIINEESGRKLYTIFIPTSPTPWTGFTEIVDEDDIIHTNLSVDECLKMVISMGVILPDAVTCGKTTVYTPQPIAEAFALTPKPKNQTHNKQY
jgi:uncharacterized membrane protein